VSIRRYWFGKHLIIKIVEKPGIAPQFDIYGLSVSLNMATVKIASIPTHARFNSESVIQQARRLGVFVQ
jgi:hypothetical protein